MIKTLNLPFKISGTEHRTLLKHFWSKWSDKYLLQLCERYFTTDKVGVSLALTPGEVVLIHDEDYPRTQWRLGRVVEVLESSDGQIRGAVLKFSTNGQVSTLKKPITCFCPLEITGLNDNMTTETAHQESVDESVSETRCAKPIRAAAQTASTPVDD